MTKSRVYSAAGCLVAASIILFEACVLAQARPARPAAPAAVQPIATFKGHEHWVISVALSPDGTLAATGSGDGGKARIWNVATGQTVQTLDTGSPAFSQAIYDVAFSPDGTRLLTAGADGWTRLWDCRTGAKVLELRPVGQEDHSALRAGFSGDGSRIYVQMGGLHVWDSASGKRLVSVAASKNTIPDGAAAMSQDGKYLFSQGPDAYVRIWDSRTGTLVRKVRNTGKPGWEYPAAAFSPDGTKYATIGGGAPKIYEMTTAQVLLTLARPRGDELSAMVLSWSPDGKLIATGSNSGVVELWAAGAGKLIKSWQGHKEAVDSLAFSPKGDRLITGGSDKIGRVWDISGLIPH